MIARSLIEYLIVVLAAWAFNRGHVWAGSVFVLAGLGLPWLDGFERTRPRALALRRPGWGLALPLSLGYLLVAIALKPGPLRPTWEIQQTVIALVEEFFFRGYLQEHVGAARWGTSGWGPLSRKNLLAALLFGLAHLLARPSPAVLLITLSGLGLGWLVERSEGSIWPAVILHAISNTAIAWLAGRFDVMG